MENNDLIKYSDNITTVLSQLDNKMDIFNFLRDLLSEKEILEFSRRFEVALLLEKEVSYAQIEEKTKMSSTTIARISKYLKWDNAWYQKAISVLKSITDKHHTGHHS